MTEVAVSAASEKRFEAALEHRYFLRLHMSAMLMLTLVSGLFTDRVLARAGLNILAIRYFLAVVAAYGIFVSSVKLWLLYLGIYAAKKSADWLNSINFSSSGSSSPSSGGSSGGSSVSFGSGGGKFGGGGATGSWGEADARPAVVPMVVQPKSPSRTGSSSSSKGGGGIDLGDFWLIVLIIALVVAVVATFAWMIWAAPAILGETAFNAMLAGALAKHAHSASRGSWIGSVFKKTALPFFLILALATVLGWYAQHYCPAAMRLADAVHCASPAF